MESDLDADGGAKQRRFRSKRSTENYFLIPAKRAGLDSWPSPDTRPLSPDSYRVFMYSSNAFFWSAGRVVPYVWPALLLPGRATS